MEIVHVLLDLWRLHVRNTRASKKKIQNSVDKIADLTYKQQQNGEKNRIFFDKAVWHPCTLREFNFFVLIGNRNLGTSSKHARNSNNTGDLVGASGRLDGRCILVFSGSPETSQTISGALARAIGNH